MGYPRSTETVGCKEAGKAVGIFPDLDDVVCFERTNHFDLFIIAVGNAASLPGRKGKGIVFGIVSDQCMAFTGYGIIVWQGNIHRGSPADKVSS